MAKPVRGWPCCVGLDYQAPVQYAPAKIFSKNIFPSSCPTISVLCPQKIFQYQLLAAFYGLTVSCYDSPMLLTGVLSCILEGMGETNGAPGAFFIGQNLNISLIFQYVTNEFNTSVISSPYGREISTGRSDPTTEISHPIRDSK